MLTTRTSPLPASSMMPASRWSSPTFNSLTSISRKQTSASLMACMVRKTENFSIPVSCLPWRRMPAVSSSSMVWPWYRTWTRLTSRVVPATLATMACCLPARVLNRLLLPTFGLPIKATRMMSSGVVAVAGGMSSAILSRSSEIPILCSVEVLMMILMPRRLNSSVWSEPLRSALLAMSRTGLPLFKAFLASWRSASDG